MSLYTHTTRAVGLILTAAIYNADHVNHADSQTALLTEGYSPDVATMRTVTDPGTVGAESLATSVAGEIARLRYAIQDITGAAQWYAGPSAINVTSPRYGATGDGVTDDTAAIQAAIDALGTTDTAPGRIVFPFGNYLTSAALRFRGGQEFVFLGATITSTSAGNIFESGAAATISYVRFWHPILTSSTAAAGINLQGVINSSLYDPAITTSAAGAKAIYLKHGDATHQCFFNNIYNPTLTAVGAGGISLAFEGTALVSGANANNVYGGKVNADIGAQFSATSNGNFIVGTRFERTAAGGTVAAKFLSSSNNYILGQAENYTETWNADAGSGGNIVELRSTSSVGFTDSGNGNKYNRYTGDGSATDIQKWSWHKMSTTHVGGGDTLNWDFPNIVADQPAKLNFFRSTPAGTGTGSLHFYQPNTATEAVAIDTTAGITVSKGGVTTAANIPIIVNESGGNMSTPTQDTQFKLYMKADKLVIQFNNGGTTRYFTLDLTQGTGPAAWASNTVAP